MTARARKITLAALALLTLSACSAGVSGVEKPPADEGAIELAVAETCTNISDPKCVSVKGEYIVLPTAFERAGVENAAVAEGQEPSTVDVTFTEEGAAIFRALTEEAARSTNSARLVVKVGGEIHGAVTVMEAATRDRTQIDFSPEISTQKAIDLIRRGQGPL